MKKIKYFIKRIFHMDFSSMFDKIEKVHKRSGKSKIVIFFDMIYCGMKYQAGYMDYFLFYFEELNSKQRKTYITRGVNDGYLKKLNDPNYYHYLRDKLEFNKRFKKYLNRDYLDLSECSYEDFEKFTEKNKVFMAKPVDLSGGYGVEKITLTKKDNIKKLYKRLVDEHKYLVEEYIIQHHKMSELCPTSVNTLRIVTVHKNGKTTVMLRAIRIGNGINPVDNFHQGGMYSLFDDKGIITKPGMDREGILFEKHPTTGVQIEGFEIPYYKESIKLVEKIAASIPEIGMAGWDIAITEKGPILIEGNELPGYDIYQSKIHLNKNKEGLKPFFDKVIYGDDNV